MWGRLPSLAELFQSQSTAMVIHVAFSPNSNQRATRRIGIDVPIASQQCPVALQQKTRSFHFHLLLNADWKRE